MKSTLMHKNIPVVDVEIDEDDGSIMKIADKHNLEHLPVGITADKNQGIPRAALNNWWHGRSIPASRDGLNDPEIIGQLGGSLTALTTKCFGLSLSDQYWIRPERPVLQWEKINFFNNDFSADVGEILFGRTPENGEYVNLISPDNTSDGWLKKKWVIQNEKRCLIKGGSGMLQQEPFNEVIASAIMRRLGVNHIPYTLYSENDTAYSLCDNFITPDTELVSAWNVCQTQKQPGHESHLQHFMNCCKSLKISNAEESINKMLTIDYIIANEDRHLNNFGAIRDAETLEWSGIAPVFDSGTSLWYESISVGAKVNSKPFKKTHDEQIKLVTDFSWFNKNALNGIGDEISDILQKSNRIDTDRRDSLCRIIEQRIKYISELSAEKSRTIISAKPIESENRYQASTLTSPKSNSAPDKDYQFGG